MAHLLGRRLSEISFAPSLLRLPGILGYAKARKIIDLAEADAYAGL